MAKIADDFMTRDFRVGARQAMRMAKDRAQFAPSRRWLTSGLDEHLGGQRAASRIGVKIRVGIRTRK